MLKRLKRWGNNLVVVFTKEEEELYELFEGDKIDISDMLVKPQKKKK